MDFSKNEKQATRFLVLALTSAAAGIGFVALLGWVLGLPLLATTESGLMPMEPSTALLLVLFGGAVFFRNRFPQHRGTYLMSIFIGSVVTFTSLLLFFFSSTGTYPPIEHLGLSITGSLDGIPIGHMSPIAAICFVVSAVSFLLTLSPSVERPKRAVAALVLACLLVLTSSAHLIAYLFGSPLMHGGSIIPASLPSSLAFLMLALGLLVTAGLQIWPYSRIKDSATERVSYVLFLIFVMLAASIVTGGYFAYRNYEKNYRQEVEHELSAIAELKVNQLVQYRAERLGDAFILFKNPSLSNLVRRFFGKANDADAQHQLQDWLGKYKSHYQYHKIFLLDTLGVTRMSVSKAQEPIASTISNRASEILISGQPAIQDFYRNENDQKIYLSVLVPILDEQHRNRPIGIVVLAIDPASYLYPFIQYWPTPNRTSETLIIRREGNDALFLNELRFQKNTALTLRSPLTNVNMPAVKAVLGKEGTVEGIDYHGVPVLANVRHIPDSPWFLVARMDISELYAPVRERLWQIILFIGVLLIGTSAGVGLVWRHQRARFYREKFQASETLRESEEKYRRLVEFLPDGVVVHSEGRIVYANPSSAKILLAESPAELTGTPVIDFVHPDYREIAFKRIKQSLSGGSIAPVMEEQFIRLDGTSFTAEVSAVPISYGDKPAMLTVFNDITERRRAEEELGTLAHALRSISECVSITDTENTILFVNQSFLKTYGYNEDELVGQNINIVGSPKTSPEVFKDVLRSTLRGGWNGELWNMRKDGSEFPISLSTSVVRDNKGERLALIGVAVDMTERKLAELEKKRSQDELRQSEQRYRTTIETAPDVIYALDAASGKITMLNPAFETVTGWSPNEWIGKNFASLVHLEDLQLATDTFQRVLRGESPPLYELRILAKSGEYLVGEFTTVPQLEGGKIVGEFGIARDITERKRAEEALRETKDQLEAILHAIADGVTVLDSDGQLIYANDVVALAAGYPSVQEMLQNYDATQSTEQYDLVDEAGYPFPVTQLPNRLVLQGRPVQSVVLGYRFKSTGAVRWSVVQARPIFDDQGKVQFVVTVMHDITERRQSEKALRENEKRYHSIVENLNQAYYEADRRGAFTYCNPGLLLISGYSEKELLGIISFKIVAEEHRKNVIALYKQWMEEKRTDMATEFMVQTKSGRKFWVGQVSHIEFDASGAFVKATNILRNIDERKQAEEALKESEQRFRTLTEFAITGVYMIQEGLFGYVNPVLATIFGYNVDEIINKLGPLDLTAPEDRDVVAENIRKRVEGVIPQIRYSFKGLRKDGQRLDIEVHGTRIEYYGMPVIIGTLLDITERMRTETDLKHTLEWQEAIFEGSRDAVFIADSQDRFVAVNIAASDLTGYTREELLKMRIPDLHEEEDLAAYNQFRDRILAGEPILSEARIKRKDGLKVSTEFSNSRVIIAGIPYMHTAARDISERKRAEESLRASEAKYRDLIERAWDAIFVVDRNGTILLANTRACELLGCEREEALKMNIADSYLAEERDVVGERIALAEKGEHWRYERAFVRKDGAVFPVEVTIGRLPDGTIQGIMRDITERKKAEEALRNSQMRYQGLFEDSPTPIWEEDFSRVKEAIDNLRKSGVDDFSMYFMDHPEFITDLVSRIRVIDLNNAVLKLYKAERKEELLNNLQAVFVDESYRALAREFALIASGKTLFDLEEEVQTLNGERRLVAIRWAAAPACELTLSRVLISVTDITERKLAELASKRAKEALRVSEDRFRSEFKENPVPAYIWQKAGDDVVLVDLNTAAEAIMHSNIDHLRGVKASVFYSDRPDIIVELSRCCAEGCTIRREMLYTFPSTRETKFLSVSYVSIRPNEIVVYAENITERKLAEQQLRTSQDQLRSLAAYLQNVREDERITIAREIHDELGQVLTALKMDLSILEKTIAEQGAGSYQREVSAEIKEMSSLVGSAIRTVQRLAKDLRPEVLDIVGLVAALRWQAEQFQQHTRIHCELSLPPERVTLDPDRSIALFRILQEALTNVARHSNATTVLVKLVVEPEAVVLEIRDNGQGISETAMTDARSFGIIGMRERAIGFGGNVEVRGIPGKGTVVMARISAVNKNVFED